MTTPVIPLELLDRIDALEGLVSPEVGLRLAELAAAVPVGRSIVEIGSFKGKSTSYLAAGAFFGGGAMVHAVDPWDLPGNAGGRFGFDNPETLEAFKRQIRLVDLVDRIIVHRNFSVDAARHWGRAGRNAIGLLFIDGSHTAKDVRADWLAWSPYLAHGAVVAFDDYRTPRNPGVAEVVDSLVGMSRWEYEPKPLAIGWLR